MHINRSVGCWWQDRTHVALVVFVLIAGYFLWTEHRAHVIEFLPWLLVLACAGMHLFMHRGHGHDDRRGEEEDDERR